MHLVFKDWRAHFVYNFFHCIWLRAWQGKNRPEEYFQYKIVSENRGLEMEAVFQHEILFISANTLSFLLTFILAICHLLGYCS